VRAAKPRAQRGERGKTLFDPVQPQTQPARNRRPSDAAENQEPGYAQECVTRVPQTMSENQCLNQCATASAEDPCRRLSKRQRGARWKGTTLSAWLRDPCSSNADPGRGRCVRTRVHAHAGLNRAENKVRVCVGPQNETARRVRKTHDRSRAGRRCARANKKSSGITFNVRRGAQQKFRKTATQTQRGAPQRRQVP